VALTEKIVAPDIWLYGKTEFNSPDACAPDRNLFVDATYLPTSNK
jgi:hypothetical protein